jgi:predicted GIY-YIG superfamily endonuclease
MKAAKPWHLYLLECADGSIYTGITPDVRQRFAAHKNGTGARYTRSHPPVALLGSHAYPDRSTAAQAEYRVKRLSAPQKRQLAQSFTMQLALAPLIHLLHSAPHAVLSTHSTQLPGFPYGTAVPLVLDERQQPLLLISAPAEHTKNLLADPRASLAVVEPGRANVQDAARVTLVGRCEAFEPTAEQVQRYLRYQPDAAQYLALDFRFFRMAVERARYIAGIGQMGWLEAAAWQAVDVIAGDKESALLGQAPVAAETRLLGVDAWGIDYETAGGRQRQRFDCPLSGEQIGRQLASQTAAPG